MLLQQQRRRGQYQQHQHQHQHLAAPGAPASPRFEAADARRCLSVPTGRKQRPAVLLSPRELQAPAVTRGKEWTHRAVRTPQRAGDRSQVEPAGAAAAAVAVAAEESPW